MCDIQSSVIHSSTPGAVLAHPELQRQEAGSLWDLASSELAWGGMPAYQGHPLWDAAAASHGAVHPAQYQADLFGFGAEFWGGGGKAGVPPHLVPGSRCGQLHSRQI